MKDSTDKVIQSAAPLAPIRLGTRDDDARLARAGTHLIIFMRCVAMLWLMEGLFHWADLLSDKSGHGLDDLSVQRVTAVFFFCVLDFVAAVGLWLATPWGGVVWLVTVGAQMLALVALPGFWQHTTALLLSDAILVSVYVYLAWRAGHGTADDS